jgi:NAD(P)-dependent dehydrogenase (short-subunit alcohol dehydrogenase family)
VSIRGTFFVGGAIIAVTALPTIAVVREEPADVASAMLFLGSAEASWITGAMLPVDGGVTAGRI